MRSSRRRGRRLNARSTGPGEDDTVNIHNPLKDKSLAWIDQQSTDFAKLTSTDDPALVELFRKAGRLAQEPDAWRDRLDPDFSEQEKHALQYEKNASLLASSWDTKLVLVISCLGAFLQGWTKSKVASLSFSDLEQTRSRDPASISSEHLDFAGMCTILLYMGRVIFFLTPFANNCVSRRARLPIATTLCFVAGMISKNATGWKQLLASRAILGIAMFINGSVTPSAVVKEMPNYPRSLVLMHWEAVNTAIGIFLGVVWSLFIAGRLTQNPPALSWRILLAAPILPPLASIIWIWKAPGSPLLYLFRGRYQSAFNAMCLRTTPLQAARDLLCANILLLSKSNEVQNRNPHDESHTIADTFSYTTFSAFLSVRGSGHMFRPRYLGGRIHEAFCLLQRAIATLMRKVKRNTWDRVRRQEFYDSLQPMIAGRNPETISVQDHLESDQEPPPMLSGQMPIELQSLRLQSLSLHRILVNAQNQSIVFHEWSSLSWLERCLNHIEQRSTCRWNWWPLPVPNVPVYRCDIRVKWTCRCGRRYYQDIPSDDGKVLQRLIESISPHRQQDQPRDHYRSIGIWEYCSWRKLFSNRTNSLFRCIGRYTNEVTVDTATEVRSSSVSSSDAQAVTFSLPSARRDGNLSSHQNQVPDTVRTEMATVPRTDEKPNHLANSLRLVFGTEGRKKGSISTDQVRLSHHMRDGDAILCMVQAYKNLRGFCKYWFSIFQLDTFEFTKFVKHGKWKVYSQAEGPIVPETDPDYEYTPGNMRPPCDERPPIHRSEFMCLLDVCPRSCLLGSFGWHECNEASSNSRIIPRLPKRKSPWELDNDNPSFAWGLECQFEISALRVLLWHIVIALTCFGPSGLLMTFFPQMIHNTAVPLAMTAIAISAFWASAGILQPHTERRKDVSRAYGGVQAYGSFIHQGDIFTTTLSPELSTETRMQARQLPYTPSVRAIDIENLTREGQRQQVIQV